MRILPSDVGLLPFRVLAAARCVRTPVLILQGGADRQVTPGQAAALAAAFASKAMPTGAIARWLSAHLR